MWPGVKLQVLWDDGQGTRMKWPWKSTAAVFFFKFASPFWTDTAGWVCRKMENTIYTAGDHLLYPIWAGNFCGPVGGNFKKMRILGEHLWGPINFASIFIMISLKFPKLTICSSDMTRLAQGGPLGCGLCSYHWTPQINHIPSSSFLSPGCFPLESPSFCHCIPSFLIFAAEIPRFMV